MAKIIHIPEYSDENGSLAVIEKLLDFEIKRVFYIYNVPKEKKRGEHGHFKTKLLLVSLAGSCKVEVNNKGVKTVFDLNSPKKGLYLEPSDWHVMSDFNEGNVLLVCASRGYDLEDYFYEPGGLE